MPRLLSVSTVAHMLDCSDDTVRRLVKRGLLRAPKSYNGVGVRFAEEDVLVYIATAGKEARQEKSSSRRKPQEAANSGSEQDS